MVVPHCFPSHDDEFRAAVEDALTRDGAAPEGAAETLRTRYPSIAVRPREQAITLEISPDHEVWYFFRDGSAHPAAEPVDAA